MPFESPFVDPAWVLENRAGLVVADSRWYLDGRSGRAAFEAGHIAGAVFVDLDTDLSDPPGPRGRHPLPDPERFAEAMGAIGIGDDSVVVVYDDAGGMVAGRMWWMLDSLGVDAAILDGGLQNWPEALVTEVTEPAAVAFTVKPWPTDRFVEADDVAGAGAGVVILDARAAERYAGEPNAIDPRFGHIPGARSAPFGATLTDGKVSTTDRLEEHFRSLGVDAETDVIAYCGSGVSACVNLAALRALGHTKARLYTGSWSEWGADEDRPLATGDE